MKIQGTFTLWLYAKGYNAGWSVLRLSKGDRRTFLTGEWDISSWLPTDLTGSQIQLGIGDNTLEGVITDAERFTEYHDLEDTLYEEVVFKLSIDGTYTGCRHYCDLSVVFGTLAGCIKNGTVLEAPELASPMPLDEYNVVFPKEDYVNI